MEGIKQSVGIDVSKDSLDVTFKEQSVNGIKIKGTRTFDNSFEGFQKLIQWSDKRQKTDRLIFVMEATGVYHEELLYCLYESQKRVVVELPQRIKYFAKSKGIKTKNDKIDSKVIADYGIERELKLWKAPSPRFKSLRDLSREHSNLNEAKSVARNRLHASKYAKDKQDEVVELLQQQIDFFEQQQAKIEKTIKEIVKQDKELKEKVKKVETIKGVGTLTVIKVLAETGGFVLFNNIRQVISYAGLDVVENQSGTINRKTRISKKGNAKLRTALYMPALSAINYDSKMKSFNNRIMNTHQHKKQGIVAVMRKLLILIYTLWKKNEEYNPNYQWGKIK